MQARGSALVLLSVAVALGALCWWGLSTATGEREAWDSGLYFLGVLPLLTAACALAASRPWRGALWIAPAFAAGEWIAMVARSGGDLGVWPIGLLFTAITHAPALGLGLAIVARHRLRDARK